MVSLTNIQKTTRNLIEMYNPLERVIEGESDEDKAKRLLRQERKKYCYRLPMGGIGTKCSRQLQYAFHNCFVKDRALEPRIRRLFDFGTLSENIIVNMLEEVGIVVTDRQTGIVGFMGHAYGYNDGVVIGLPEAPKTPHLLEIKTHNRKYFLVLKKQGVRLGFKAHYDQCQRYMRELNLERTLYIGYCKDDSDIYIERIEFNKSYADDLFRKEAHVIMATELDDRLPEKEAKMKCSWCGAKGVCQSGMPVYPNCRNCDHVDKEQDGKWYCEHHLIDLSRDQQNEGCSSWKINPMFVNDLAR